jgi:hypothetical protein
MSKYSISPMLEAQSNAALNLFRGVSEVDFSEWTIKEFLRDKGISKSALLKILDHLAQENLLELKATGSRIFINLTKSGKLKCLNN